MSAIDWRPGPRLRAAMDADQALAHMQRNALGGYGLTVRRGMTFSQLVRRAVKAEIKRTGK